MKDDVLIVGAGPAGTVAATLLAREGMRVRLIDRSTFPRDKLCGDTVNPGTVAALARLGLSGALEVRGLPVDGMRVSGPWGTVVEGRYPSGMRGRALLRRDLDQSLLEQAVAAGTQFESGVAARRPSVDESTTALTVRGVFVGREGRERELRAPVTIAADGRHSALAFSLGLARHPARPRRWAIGSYYEHVEGLSSLGEMHLRPGRYIGIAPMPGGLANVCLVKAMRPREPLGNPGELLAGTLARDPLLRGRFTNARLAQAPLVLGPLAVDVSGDLPAGLILAGDAGGFIDPMTGDGLSFAVRGAALAAAAAREVLEKGWPGVHERLARARHAEFAQKWRLNRTLRAIVASAVLVEAGAAAARLLPAAVRRLVAEAGDCALAQSLADGHMWPR